MALFTYLKIILLHCIHFSIFNHKRYSNRPKFNLNKYIYIYIYTHDETIKTYKKERTKNLRGETKLKIHTMSKNNYDSSFIIYI